VSIQTSGECTLSFSMSKPKTYEKSGYEDLEYVPIGKLNHHKKIEECIEQLSIYFDSCYINDIYELIIEPKNNVYFMLYDLLSLEADEIEINFKRKFIEWVSRSAHKHVTPYWKNWFKRGFKSYLCVNFSDDDLKVIYTKLGNGVNQKLAIKFIESNFDVSLLRNAK